MAFADLLGQETALATLERALGAGRVHHAYRFEGPDGVGKETAAFALAQALVCAERPGGRGPACGACSACRRAVTLSEGPPAVPQHPDVILVERGLYPPALLGRSREEAQDISVDQVRKVVLARLSFPPHEGRARVFLVRRADELGVAAANALLKTLEEPPPGNHFVLLTARPRELIDTIRSRTFAVRFAPLGEGALRTILGRNGVPEAAQELAVELSGGGARAALESADAEAVAERQAFFDALREAVEAPDMARAIALAARCRDKAALGERLRAFAASLARSARGALAADERRALSDARRFEVVSRALRDLERNASPALALEAMVLRLRSLG
ncbi:MAG TPA: DNA polymerase III subunit delta' [Polyangiaceae bacterium]|nr:DNA polymerase III subunit delta' [Polyangiaceae bacterium]